MILSLIIIAILLGVGIWGWPLLAGVLGLSSVTDKAGAIKQINQLMHTYNITLAEVETAFTTAMTASTTSRRDKSDIAKTLFIYLGAIFILAGIGTYIGLFWGSMGSVMRIFVTLGVGYILLIVLVSALYESKYPKLILPLALACVFMMTSGWFVFVDEVFSQSNNWRIAVLFVFGTMAVHQSILLGKYQLSIFAFTALFFVYGFMHVGLDILGIPVAYIAIILGASLFLVSSALEKTTHRILVEPALLIGGCWLNSGLFERVANFTSTNWASLLIGLCLISTAYGLQKADRYPRLIILAYFGGSILFYSGLFDLIENTPVDLLFLVATASILYICVVLQSRTLLLTTVIAMLGFIGYYSAKHFSDSLGWPVTLVLMGIAFLAVGTIAIKVKRKI